MESNNLNWGKVTPVKPCRFPRPRRFKRYIRQMQRAFPGWKRGSVLIVEPRENWELKRHPISGRVISRSISVRIYRRDHLVRVRCPSKDPGAVCSASRSKTATRADEATERLQQAQAHRAKGLTIFCQIDSWGAIRAVRQARTIRKRLKARRRWKENLRYHVVGSGTDSFTEKQLFNYLAKKERQATALFRKCGGPAQVPFRPGRDDR